MLGISFEKDPNRIPPELAHLISRKHGGFADIVRLMRQIPPLRRSDGTYDFTTVIQDLKTIRDAGMITYLNFYFLPRQWTGGIPVTENYNECFGIVKKPESFCSSMPLVDSKQVRVFATEAAKQLGNLVDFVSAGPINEPGQPYWLARSVDENDAPKPDMNRLFVEVMKPFVWGWIEGLQPTLYSLYAKFVGPEADLYTRRTVLGDLDIIEQQEQAHEAGIDRVSVHYPDIDSLVDYVRIADSMLKGRKLWVTEQHMDPEKVIPYLHEAAKYPQIECPAMWHSFTDLLFEPETIDRLTCLPTTERGYVTNKVFRELVAYTNPVRRRGVGK